MDLKSIRDLIKNNLELKLDNFNEISSSNKNSFKLLISKKESKLESNYIVELVLLKEINSEDYGVIFQAKLLHPNVKNISVILEIYKSFGEILKEKTYIIEGNNKNVLDELQRLIKLFKDALIYNFEKFYLNN